MECELEDIVDTSIHAIVGKIVNVSAEESVLGLNGKVDPVKLDALLVDTFQNGYYTIGEKTGQAFHEGMDLLRKK